MTVESSSSSPSVVWFVRKRPRVAGLLVAVCFCGAGLLAWHWAETGWEARRAELFPTPQAFSEARQALAETAGDPRPWGLVLLAAGGLLGSAVFASKNVRHLSGAAGWTLVALALLHLVEDKLIRDVLDHPADAGALPQVLWLQGVAFIGFALAPVAGLAAIIGGVKTLARLVTFRPEHAPATPPDTTGDGGAKDHWHRSFALPDGREPGGLGICLSGGGIRSATFSLGALQSLQERTLPKEKECELSRARYLTAVSGGGYAAGALLLGVRSQVPDTGETASNPADLAACNPADLDYSGVFTPGSPEFDYLRQHTSYIADGWREWFVATVVVLRGALLSTLLLALVAVTAGRWAGYLYGRAGRANDLANPFHPAWGAVFATLVIVGAALLLWLTSLTTKLSHRPRLRQTLGQGAFTLTAAFVVVVALGVLVPIVARAAAFVVGDEKNLNFLAEAVKGWMLGAVGVVSTVAGLLFRHRRDITTAAGPDKTGWKAFGDLGGRVSQWLAVYAGLALIAAIYLLVFGNATYRAALEVPDEHLTVTWGWPQWTFPLTNLQFTFALTVVLFMLYLSVDETAIGLHPFYRRRLATAFAVRRVPDDRPSAGPGRYRAKAYPWPEETTLELYGNPYRNNHPMRPQVIFCAAAHCSDPDQTPPGRHTLPFTFSYDALGGPEVGWCPLNRLRQSSISSRLQMDLTVQTAMAVSGAAFASATGTFRGPANTILALLNARLGTWSPNPSSIIRPDRQWWHARPPKVRRLSYLFRELFGLYPKELPLLFLSDGGHLENLGLTELIRHRCTEIYCFDATSDTDTFAAALGRSILLARDEFGVTIHLDHPDRADPHGISAPEAESDLKGRLSKTSIITGTITYPDLGPGLPNFTAPLVIGRAVLDEHAPWEIQRHAVEHPLFPHDATGDQWFDDRKFNAYTELGRHVGRQAISARANSNGLPVALRWPPSPAASPPTRAAPSRTES